MKKHKGFLIFFTVTILIFLWKLISLRYAFIEGDYADQFYPWSLIYSDAIKSMQFPFWLRFVHSGFPLMAEGQVGGFYPLNILFSFLMPFIVAYNYLTIFHFVLVGVFTYFFTRRIGACEWGGALAAFLFCFGSAYAGCMINTAVLKTLTWLPLVLWLYEEYFNKKKVWLMFFSGIIIGFQLLAGATQMAIYSALFSGIYFISGLFFRKELKLRDLGLLVISFMLAAVIFMPQFMLSWQLVSLSRRASASLAFALWGSFSPFNFMSTLIPFLISHGVRFYLGVFSILFLIASFVYAKGNKKVYPILILSILSFLMAFGKFNPVYVLAIKLTKLYSFRNPSKFLMFSAFGMSVLMGLGFTRFFEQGWSKAKEKILRIFSMFIGIMVGIFVLAKVMLIFFGEKIFDVGLWYVKKFIHGDGFHRYDLSEYARKVEVFYTNLTQNFSMMNPFILFSIILCLAGVGLSLLLLRKKRTAFFYKVLFFALIFIDICVFSIYGTGFRGNIKNLDTLSPACPTVFKTIQNDKSLFRIMPYYVASGKLPNWAIPTMNAVYGIDSAGLYTPLVADYYYRRLEGLEIVDNALGLLKPEDNALNDNEEIIKLLNIKYIVSPEPIECSFARFRIEENGTYLYQVEDYMSRGYVVSSIEGPYGFLQKDPVNIEYRSGKAVFVTDIEQEGFFVFSEFNFPGWHAYVDGEEVDIRTFQDILIAIQLPEGSHRVEFVYRPFKNKDRE